jgi:hypothetical protein
MQLYSVLGIGGPDFRVKWTHRTKQLLEAVANNVEMCGLIEERIVSNNFSGVELITYGL